MRNALSSRHSDILLRQGTKGYKSLRATVNDTLGDQRQQQLISHEERSRDRAAPAHSSDTGEGKGQDCKSWTAKGPCSKGSKCSVEHNASNAGKGKGQLSRSLALREDASDTSGVLIRRPGKSPSGKNERPPCFDYMNGAYSCDRGGDYGLMT